MANNVKIVDAFGQVERKRNANWQQISVGEVMAAGHVLRTGPGGAALLLLQDGHRVRVGEKTILVLTKLGEGKIFALNITSGQVWVLVNKASKPNSFTVETPTAAARVMGTLFGMAMDDVTSESVVDIAEGTVEVNSVGVRRGARVVLKAGQLTRVAGGPNAPKTKPQLRAEPHGAGSKAMWKQILSEGAWARQDGKGGFRLQRGREGNLWHWWRAR